MKRLLSTIVLLLLAIAGHATCYTCACTSCPITSWSQYQVYAIDDNNTPCNVNDDVRPVKIKINHSANAQYSGSFTVKVGSGTAVSYAYTAGTDTYIMLYLPYGTPANVSIEVKDATYNNCTWNGNLNCAANYGVPCPSTCGCNACPISSWEQHWLGTPNNNGTVCYKNDDYRPAKIKVYHLACAENTGDGKFTVKVGSGTPFLVNYSTGTYTIVDFDLPYNTPNNVQVIVSDGAFNGCVETGNLNCAAFNGVSDNTPPTIATPVLPLPPIFASTSSCTICTPGNACGTNVFFVPPTATDNCGPVTVTSNKTPNSFFPVGTTNVTYTFTDGSGNSTSVTFQVIVTDNTRPTVVCKPTSTVVSVPAGTPIDPFCIIQTSSDNCGIVSRTTTPSQFTCADVGQSKTVKVVVTDAAGNKDSCSRQVMVTGTPCPPPCTHTCSITTTPCNSTNIGPVQTNGAYNMFLGYGPQSMTLQANSSTNGAGCTYSWTRLGNTPAGALSSTTSANPVFTPSCAGLYKYAVTISNCSGCNVPTTCTVSICVKDVRYDDGCGYDKVLMCYAPGNCAPSTIAVHPLIAYYFMEYCSDFTLGYCGQTCPSFGGSGYRLAAGGGDEIKPEGQEAVDKLVDQYGIGKLMADKAFDMVVFPNPSKTDFRLRIQSVIGEKAEVRVFDVAGRVVEQASIKTNVDEVVGRNLAPGAYIIEVNHGGHVKKTRAVKQ